MIDLQDKGYCPTIEELETYVQNTVFSQFYSEIKELYQCQEQIEFSSCSWEAGWNVKLKKAGKTLCTIYPRESYFTVMIVVGRKEKEQVEILLPQCTTTLQEIYAQTKEGNGQRWLMIDLEEKKSYIKMYCALLKFAEDDKKGRLD